MSINQLVTSGPLILALPVAAAAGAVTFLSPCCLPLVPGYLSFVTGMAGAGGSPATSVAAQAPAAATPDGSVVAVAAPPLAATPTGHTTKLRRPDHDEPPYPSSAREDLPRASRSAGGSPV